MGARSSQLQIRVTPAEKAALKGLADAAGQSVSSYVLSRVLPSDEQIISHLYEQLIESDADHRRILTRLQAALARLSGAELRERVPPPDPEGLGAVLLNSVAALVETAAHEQAVEPPAWVATVARLPKPHFGWPLVSLRPHQLRVTPVPFKRRNLFFDPAAALAPVGPREPTS